MLIRVAVEEDLPSILEMYGQPSMDGTALSLSDAALLFKFFSEDKNRHLYVVIENGKILGSFCIIIMQMFSRKGSKTGILEDVVVREDCQGKGIGKMMMAFANDMCEQAGCYKIVLASGLHREDAHTFYEKLGYRKQGYCFSLELTACLQDATTFPANIPSRPPPVV